jgi:hypothetical protein
MILLHSRIRILRHERSSPVYLVGASPASGSRRCWKAGAAVCRHPVPSPSTMSALALGAYTHALAGMALTLGISMAKRPGPRPGGARDEDDDGVPTNFSELVDFLHDRLEPDDFVAVAGLLADLSADRSGLASDSRYGVTTIMGNDTVAELRAIQRAEEATRPILGMDGAQRYSTAAGIYKAAIKALGYDTTGLIGLGCERAFDLVKHRPRRSMAADTAMIEKMKAQFPHLDSLKKGSFAQRYVKRHGLAPPFRHDSGVHGYDPGGNIGRMQSSRS